LLDGGRPPLPSGLPQQADDGRRITVWFNAWKYQSTEQVWAGLADCIVRAITDRLSPADREKFWLHLQWARIDADKVRRTFWNQVFSTFFGYFLGMPWGHLIALLAGGVAAWKTGAQGLVWGGVSFTVAELVQAGATLGRVMHQTKRRDLKVDFADYVSAPDYSARAGFIHHVADDLRQVLDLVPAAQKPVVVFVDDLDRCSPGKVAEVMEAINLFLAGDFREFQFVIAMDTEMVAAALEVAHKEIVARLPEGAGDTPLGWRFMDKFVQLPFLLPPPDARDCETYLQSLFEAEAAAAAAARPAADGAGRGGPDGGGAAAAPELTFAEKAAFRREAEAFSDRDPAIRQQIIAAALQFSDNPRELKRFVNLLRFYWYLRAARVARDLPAPSDEQLARWATLTLRWPQAARWVHQGEGARRLRLLEEAGEALRHRSDTPAVVRAVLGVPPERHPWTLDPTLWAFFGGATGEPLSAAAGMGLW
ncbi:MAG TPA: P-loop NTPase fold protein, partial [Symbiobacteriaceae bacterium]|nr:P-loop NTPase fold protein [Symbiobacteriaceae bacterium]